MTDVNPTPPHRDSWFDGLELEASTTLWSFSAPQMRSFDDDWSLAEASPKYQVSPTILYRGDLRLFTRLIDASVAYESRSGLSFMGEEGSLLDLAFSLPRLLPELDPLSLHYRRVRFAEGHVSLTEHGGAEIERQRFEMALDDYELWWSLGELPQTSVTLKVGWHERALPRHIYLQETVNAGEDNSYSIYYAISDQLLWTPSQSLDVGVNMTLHLDPLTIALGGSLGGGSYELQTPLEGERLDQGSLLTLAGSWGLHYEQPLTSWLSLRLSYEGWLLALEPLSLPAELKRELRVDGEDLSDLSLSFGSRDLVQKFWLSVLLHIE